MLDFGRKHYPSRLHFGTLLSVFTRKLTCALMNLKSLKLAGFKSFVDPTNVPFRSNMNLVAGPNGCGKSNIVDAIRWVIGETSAKQLRGQSMTDVIFNGTTARKPVSKAQVELTFDNSDGRIGGQYASYSEIAIRRELERDGQSGYFINGTLCRRRDIIDIFLGTGLGPRSYSIIEQGMISQLVEAKPEEFRVYLEEAAGISKYKERRRETENRIRRTQENLDRINDLCEELTKQLRHLKRQANAAERYKHFKDEERKLHAEIKVLQWQALAEQLAGFDERLNAANLQYEERLADQRHTETDIEKTRVSQTEANDQFNDVQKRYYSLGAEIARIEQRIKDKQEQTQRWKKELEEAETLWQELTESSAEHQDQIQELTEEIAELSPQADTIQSIAENAQKALQEADANMNAWQMEWETFQKTSAESSQQAEVARTKIAHHQQQIETLTQRQQRLNESFEPQQLTILFDELEPIDTQASELTAQLEAIQTELNQLADQVRQQRQQNTERSAQLNQLQRELQTDEGRHSSLVSLQEAALSNEQQVNAWLDAHQLTDAPRLGKTLRVNPGWELAVEMVLGHYFDAVCVDDFSSFAHQMNFDQGSLTLVDRSSSHSNVDKKAASLADQVNSDWPLVGWLGAIYTASNASEAYAMRSQLASHESVITQDGLWLGVNWMRQSKPSDSEEGVLAREQEIQTLSNRIAEKQDEVDRAQRVLNEGEAKLAELENLREQQHQRYRDVSTELTQVKSQLGAKRSRYDELQQQQVRLQQEVEHAQTQLTQSTSALEQAEQQLAQAEQQITAQNETKARLTEERDRLRSILDQARITAQREQQKADELDIRLTSGQNQLDLLKQTMSRAERQMQQLKERREHLTEQLADTNNPIDALNAELQEHLNRRIVIENELRTAEQQLESLNHHLRQLEEKRNAFQQQISDIKDQLQAIQMERQALTVRQTTIKEQLVESEFELETLVEEMSDDANIAEWEQRAEGLAQKISRLGPINLAAIEEYDQVSERKIYLDKQQEDLHEALDVLQNAIRKIDRETKQKFRETYEKVDAGFRALFPKIFGGGAASLELDEEDDLLTSGVIVRAQPPGKRNSTIHMLSGGEKALTAISLLFALFQLNPAPFCVLDEVDAPLDDVNVGRFAQLVKEMSKTTQFIVISHNKVTIEMGDYLMGVTMQEPGVSRIVSVDMEEAIAMAE